MHVGLGRLVDSRRIPLPSPFKITAPRADSPLQRLADVVLPYQATATRAARMARYRPIAGLTPERPMPTGFGAFGIVVGGKVDHLGASGAAVSSPPGSVTETRRGTSKPRARINMTSA